LYVKILRFKRRYLADNRQGLPRRGFGRRRREKLTAACVLLRVQLLECLRHFLTAQKNQARICNHRVGIIAQIDHVYSTKACVPIVPAVADARSKETHSRTLNPMVLERLTTAQAVG